MVKKSQAYKERADGQYVCKHATVLYSRIKVNFFSEINEDTWDIGDPLLKIAQL